jgi:amidase
MERREFPGGTAALGVALSLPRSILASDLPAELTALTASQLSAAIRQGHTSCAEVMQAYLSHIHRHNPVYNAVVSMVDDEYALAQARSADQALARSDYWGWMHGMPHAVKDLASANGLHVCWGSPLYANFVATEDELHISRIRAQGAIFIGKTNTPEFGLGSQSYNPVHGVTGCAYNPKLTSGGSSGGAACGLATHMLPVADGSDMMGSLRNPGAFNNVVGFRPSQGRVPSVPSDDLFYMQLSTDGPMGRNVEDTIRLLGTMSGFDPRSPLSRADTLPGYDSHIPAELKGYRIGWMGDYNGYLPTEPGLLELCRTALNGLEQAGVVVEECQPDYDMGRLWQTWLTFRHWSMGGDLKLYDNPETRRQLKPELVWEIEGSFAMPAARVHDAAVARADWYRSLLVLFDSYDILALPTAQVFPFPKEIHWPGSIAGKQMDTYHRWMEVVIGGTLAGLPVVNLPAGFDSTGRPMGMQFIGRMGQDQRVLEFAMSYERVTDYLQRRPELQQASS